MDYKKNDLFIESKSIKFIFMESGDIKEIKFNGDNRINSYIGNRITGSISNIYLRLKNTKEYTKLIGIDSPSNFSISKNGALYKGAFKNIEYELKLDIKENMWFYTLSFLRLNEEVEVFYGQDIFLNWKTQNEAYASQYLNHEYSPLDSSITTHENQGMNYSIKEGSFNQVDSYSTDGFEFFSKEYKLTNTPKSMTSDHLDNYNYQYEMAYTAFKVDVKERENVVFYADFIPDLKNESQHSLSSIKEIYSSLDRNTYKAVKKPKLAISYNNILNGIDYNIEDINKFYPNREFNEYKDNKELLSFFMPNSTHVVLKAKETLLERPSANLMISNGRTKEIDKTYAVTCYMFGAFLTHICLGNTNMNKFITTQKDQLNIDKTEGVRIIVKYHNEYRILSLPSSFEMKASSTKWHYKLEDDELLVDAVMSYDKKNVSLSLKSLNNISYDFIVSSSLKIGPEETENIINPVFKDNKVYFSFEESNLAGKLEKDYSFMIDPKDSDAEFDQSLMDESILLIKYNNKSSFSLNYTGLINNVEPIILKSDEEERIYDNGFYKLTGNISIETTDLNILKFKHLIYWYVHDALVHFSSPHGLEQYSGAAWGTRDALQGPLELFKSFHDYEMVKFIILKVYSKQFIENSDWPQWFMLDNYAFIHPHDSNGDIIVWPLKVLSDYINETNDYSILDIEVPFTSMETGEEISSATIKEHVKREIERIKSTFISGTSLPCYGNGDWDDTLSPVDKECRLRMVSPWTSSLFLEALSLYSDLTNEYKELVEKVKEDYKKYLYKDGIVAGFVRFDNDGIKYFLHPSDNITGLKCRLLPITRNMISEFMDPKDKDKYLKIIDEKLMYPDGVRLMDNTVKYHGGESTLFMRAESAANFGREISLLYVHAHIRYIEAMAKLGEKPRIYKALNVINPILIKDNVSNAEYRQSNSYFSSSDAEFNDRYIANDNIYKIKTQEVKVKGGWRVYSSGPGIYLYELIGNFFGLKLLKDKIYIDPMISSTSKLVDIKFGRENRNYHVIYHLNGQNLSKVLFNGNINSEREKVNKYRESGFSFDKTILKENNLIEIYFE